MDKHESLPTRSSASSVADMEIKRSVEPGEGGAMKEIGTRC